MLVNACGAAASREVEGEQEDQVSDDAMTSPASYQRRGNGGLLCLAPYLCPNKEIDIRRGCSRRSDGRVVRTMRQTSYVYDESFWGP